MKFAVRTMLINSSTLISDNIVELLVKILEFTRNRHQVLAENISNINEAGFVPKDLAVDEFAGLMDGAIDEHQQSRRLVLYDTKNFKFGYNGAFETAAFVDEYARQLFENDINGYLELQKKKLCENLLNHRVAGELLKQRRSATAIMKND